MKFLKEILKDITDENARYGITTVQPDRALKKCKIRNILVEYFLTETAHHIGCTKTLRHLHKKRLLHKRFRWTNHTEIQ